MRFSEDGADKGHQTGVFLADNRIHMWFIHWNINILWSNLLQLMLMLCHCYFSVSFCYLPWQEVYFWLETQWAKKATSESFWPRFIHTWMDVNLCRSLNIMNTLTLINTAQCCCNTETAVNILFHKKDSRNPLTEFLVNYFFYIPFFSKSF